MTRYRTRLRVGGIALHLVTIIVISAAASQAMVGQRAPIASASTTGQQLQEDLRWPRVFTNARSVRELSDGSVIVLDPQDRAVVVLPSAPGAARQIGRTGAGPGEYRYPVLLAALGGDSTIIVDAQNRRWLLLMGTQFVELRGPLRDLAEQVNNDLAGLDHTGRALTIATKAKPGTLQAELNDSALSDTLLAIITKMSGERVTVTQLASSSSGRKMVNVPGVSYPFSLPNLLNSSDQAVLFLDGSIAVARLSPYRVDWRTPAGQWVRGPVVQETKVPVTRKIQQFVVRNFKQRPDGSPFFRVEDFPPWPTHVPHFRLGALLAGSDGNLYVRRTVIDKGTAQLVDVFDRSGVRLRTIAMPPHSRLVGSGVRGLYVAEKNEDDEEVLVRMKWP